MLAYRAKVRVLLFFLVLSCQSGAILAHVQEASLPYGKIAGPILASSLLAASGAAGAAFFRYRRLWRTLTGGQQFVIPVEEIPSKADHTFVAQGFAWRGEHVECLQALTLAGVSVSPEKKDELAGKAMLPGVGGGEVPGLF